VEKRKIFLVDDETDLLDAYQVTLRGEYQVEAFVSAVSALQAISAGSLPDLFVTDIKMPEMDGLKFVAELRKRKIEQPIIVISGHADKAHAIEAIKLGAVDFIEKPFSADFFRNIVRKAAILSMYQRLRVDLLAKYCGLSESLIRLARSYEARFLAAEDQLYKLNAVSNMDKKSVTELIRSTRTSADLEKVVEAAQAQLRELHQWEQDILALTSGAD
jgi:FixJ family two-component response regulator